MGVLLGLLSAVCYGASDFIAGVAGRRAESRAVAMVVQPWGLIGAVLAVLLLSPERPTTTALLWGAVSGIGSGVGTLALYHGLAVSRMSTVAPISAVLAAAVPALIGWATGDQLSGLAWGGIVLALPAIALVSSHPGGAGHDARAGVISGILAGLGFATLFVALARAGTDSGGWPLVPGQAIAVLIIGGATLGRNRPPRSTWRAVLLMGTIAGIVAGAANLLYLAATGAGQLAVVAVLASLYPAVTIMLARLLLAEHWTRPQVVGLLISGAAVTAIALG